VSTEFATILQEGESFLLGGWRVEPTLNRLSRGGEAIQLEHKAMDVLLCLVEHAGELVGKHDLLDAVWQTEFVSDNSLQRRVANLREALGDDAQDPRYIETIRKRGYRLIAEVAAIDDVSASPALPEIRTPGDEERNPYPGLSAFTESDADVFFGREREVGALWRRITSRRLLAVIGPSGVGKSSLLRAGVAAWAPPAWRVVVVTPGDDPHMNLARALAPDLAGDPRAVSRLVGFADPDTALAVVARWRGLFDKAVLVVDQFEELFTLSPAETQTRFVDLLRRLVDAADVHVVLAMRDDFLHRCQPFPAIAPIFDGLTPLGPPSADALRRALTEPAARRLHRFENERLVDRIVAEVENQRGALPLLAFALCRMWDKRDGDERLLTEQSYEDIGGIAGALARHAEEVIGEIGADRLPIVREIFRNLVTAEGTRAVREVDELLSVFEVDEVRKLESEKVRKAAPPSVASKKLRVRIAPSHSERSERSPFTATEGSGLTPDSPARDAASEVLRKLIDARLLTSYEVRDEDGDSTRRVEIIHESLLANWPRLVRWRTQDQEGAQLRDELRQAARTWDEHGRHDDRLWSGTAYHEYLLWRDRYPGRLSEVEEAFAAAMTTLASRRRRRRRIAIAAALLIAVAVGAVTTTLWRRSVAEARRAEAGKLLALGQAQIEDDPTAALAYARASLELADTPEARRFAVEVLWRGPVARILPIGSVARRAGLRDDPGWNRRYTLSPDGRWLAAAWGDDGQVLLFPAEGGSPRVVPGGADGTVDVLGFGPHGDRLVTGGSSSSMRFWSVPELEEIRSVELGGQRSSGLIRGGTLLTFTRTGSDAGDWLARAWPFDAGGPEVLDSSLFTQGPWDLDSRGTVVGQFRDRAVLLRPLNPSSALAERIVGEAADAVVDLAIAPDGSHVATLDESGEIRVWSTAEGDTGPSHVFNGPGFEFRATWFDPTGRIVTQLGPNNEILLWDLDSPPGTEPRVVRRRVPSSATQVQFDPEGRWLVTNIGESTIELWSLEMPWARTYTNIPSSVWSLAFDNECRRLVICPVRQRVRLWPLDAESGSPRVLAAPERCWGIAIHPARDEILVASEGGEVLLYPSPDAPPRALPGDFAGVGVPCPAFDLEGRRVASFPSNPSGMGDPEDRALHVWDLESGEQQAYSVAHLTDADWIGSTVSFAHDDSLYASLGNGDRTMRLTLPSAPGGAITAETIHTGGASSPTMSLDGRFLMVHAGRGSSDEFFRFEKLLLFDLAQGTSRTVTTHGTRLRRITQVDPTGRVLVTGDIEGVVRAGPISGGEPHLLLGHEGMILGLTISPDGRWIASASDDSIRLWPMPDVTKPPLHTLPHDELLAKLDGFTNLRAVRDPESSTGWTLEIGPFPGWGTVPRGDHSMTDSE
jgi:DNA-binding winged helix-turn-helix (wHTH) protein/WD40 repeat protein